ncbi:MAG TPA: dihydrodipicolinate synthase family protein [Gemmatimonadales bacterium]|nr:dihydrodipicolinate synthase family protein [Gemmatimonadales bacterium]
MSARAAEQLAARLGGLIPAVPVPFRGSTLAEDAQQAYVRWMAGQAISGVAVWAHTGRGPYLAPGDRRTVLATWRAALPGRVVVAGANSPHMAHEARAGGADAVLAFPRRDDPVSYHRALGAELPVLAFYLYEAAGGVAYDPETLCRIMDLPEVVGIKIATLDSVITFQSIAEILRAYPDKALITGEDRFLGYSLMLGASGALIGMGSALTDLQAQLLKAYVGEDYPAFHTLSARIDRFAAATFTAPMEGYIRRMLWALAAERVIPDDACDDPWGPPLDERDRSRVRSAVREARAQ